MNKTTKIYGTLLAAAMAAMPAGSAAQNTTNSPYSRYGYGVLSDRSQGFNKAMAGVAQGFRDATMVNSLNPASYSAVDSLTLLFDVGVSMQFANLKQGSLKTNAYNSSLDYINAQFRAWRNVGMSLGLLPLSSIGYSFKNKQTLSDIDGSGEKTETTTYNGDGGLHEIYLGAGWRMFKNFSVGANVGFVWGDYSHTIQAVFSDNNVYQYRRAYTADIATYKIDFGAQYNTLVSKKDMLTFGATYSLGHGIDSKAKFISQVANSTGSVSTGDTVTVNNAFELPHSVSAGVMWNHNDRWKVGLDYSLELWKNTKFPQLSTQDGANTYASSTGAFNNRHRIALGAEYLPNTLGVKYRDHIRYRAGVSYGNSYVKANSQDAARDILVTAGVGLPIANIINNRSVLNVSAQWENIKPKGPGSITENYVRICIGITFNESWFQKWKFK
jgi:plastocyanin